MRDSVSIFLIHRFRDKENALNSLKVASRGLPFKVRILTETEAIDESWKHKAEQKIIRADAIFIFNRSNCEDSPNTNWEISVAGHRQKKIFNFTEQTEALEIQKTLNSIYDYDDEFDNCFPAKNTHDPSILESYKIILQTSEDLIQRRHITNGFFTTIIIGSLTALSFLTGENSPISENTWILSIPAALGATLCQSWRNLLMNYGKLNTAKYRVIQKLENSLNSRPFTAEWYALGNGKQPNKYKSFTKTEAIVPIYFMISFIGLSLYFASQAPFPKHSAISETFRTGASLIENILLLKAE